MAFEPWQIQVLQHYGLADAAGNLVLVKLESLGDAQPAPKVDPEVIGKLFSADTTPTHKWSGLGANGESWVFLQAGGGKASRDQSERHLEYLKQRYVHQYGEDKWPDAEPLFRGELFNADQEVCTRMRNNFGFFRSWPGRDNVYEKVVVTLTAYLKQYRKLTEMNKTLDPSAVQATEPADIETLDMMKEINRKVANWVAAKKVRTDVRLASHQQEDWIYNDDYIMAIAPLTYAAAVKYGWAAWQIADPQQFATVAQGELSRNPWDSFVSKGGTVVMLKFNVPMPWWIRQASREEDQIKSKMASFENLLLNLTKETARQDPNTWTVIDEENNETMTIAQIKTMLQHEVIRAGKPAPEVPAEEMPVVRRGYNQQAHPFYKPNTSFPPGRGGSAVSDETEVEKIISHLDLCLAEVKRWATGFKGQLARVAPGD